MQRLDKTIANQGVDSRSNVRKNISKGNVTVNGEVIRKFDYKVDEENDVFTYCGQDVTFNRNLYIMMNKPQGVVSATKDNLSQSIIELLPAELYRKGLFPAGRLDKDTEGFMLITDDGDFAHRMLSPKNEVHKIYRAVLEKPVTNEDIQAFEQGVVFKDGTVCRKAILTVIEDSQNPLVEVDIHEGKFHQVKKMFLARENSVLELKRCQIGKVKLDSKLELGECRLMTKEEIAEIFG